MNGVGGIFAKIFRIPGHTLKGAQKASHTIHKVSNTIGDTFSNLHQSQQSVKAAPAGSRFTTLWAEIKRYCGLIFQWGKAQAKRFINWVKPAFTFWKEEAAVALAKGK